MNRARLNNGPSEMPSGSETHDPRYRAPALEKGLDILELLAGSEEGLSPVDVAQRLGRSHGELFRMVKVLQHRGYVCRASAGATLKLTDKPFQLAPRRREIGSLIEVALLVLRRLAREIDQSCFLAFHSMGQVVVVAGVEGSNEFGISTQVGFRQPLLASASGRVLLAFQPADVQARWRNQMSPRPRDRDWECELSCTARIRARGWHSSASSIARNVRDISAPVLTGGRAAAAINVPYLPTREADPDDQAVADHIIAAAAQISTKLAGPDACASSIESIVEV